MLGKLAKTIAVTAFAGGSVLLSAGTASATHCTGLLQKRWLSLASLTSAPTMCSRPTTLRARAANRCDLVTPGASTISGCAACESLRP
jgi:hypothetical protein